MAPDETMRLDELLVARGLYPSRSRARDAVARGTVFVEGIAARKAGQTVTDAVRIELADPARDYVSRAALKLVHALDTFAIDVNGATALDIGASTGGFTQVLLERGAARVLAVDVGHGQMHARLREDRRVVALEGLNARALTGEHLQGCAPDIVVSDVSFISLRLALPPALGLAGPGASCVLLVKPQFEAGREAIGKGGLLRDARLGEAVAQELRMWLNELPGWRAAGLVVSPIEGGDGNREYLLHGRKQR